MTKLIKAKELIKELVRNDMPVEGIIRSLKILYSDSKEDLKKEIEEDIQKDQCIYSLIIIEALNLNIVLLQSRMIFNIQCDLDQISTIDKDTLGTLINMLHLIKACKITNPLKAYLLNREIKNYSNPIVRHLGDLL